MVKEESYEILGQIKVKINRDGQKTDFAECKIYDRELRTDRTVDVYYAYYEKPTYGAEVYQGPNYVGTAHSKEKSYSRHYAKLKGLPPKYNSLVRLLIEALWQHGSKLPQRV